MCRSHSYPGFLSFPRSNLVCSSIKLSAVGSRSPSSLLETKLTSRHSDFTREELIASNVDRVSVVHFNFLYHIFISEFWFLEKLLDFQRVHILVFVSIGWSVKARLGNLLDVYCVRLFIINYKVFLLLFFIFFSIWRVWKPIILCLYSFLFNQMSK